MMKVILFGFGRAGKIHYQNIVNHPNMDLIYLVELINIQDKIKPSVTYIDYKQISRVREILSDQDIKAVFITTPTKSHFELIKLCLEYQKHVFVEKPVTHNLDQIEELFSLANKNNLILAVGYNRRYDPIISNIKNQISNKKIGKINYALTISRDYPYPTEQFLSISGGIFHDCATHDIDYLNWILDERPNKVYASIGNNEPRLDHNYQYVLINLYYPSGAQACLNLSRISDSYDQRCEFYGENGEIINNNYQSETKISFPERYKQAYINELEEFYQSIVNNKSSIVTQEDCQANFKIAEACEQSISLGQLTEIIY